MKDHAMSGSIQQDPIDLMPGQGQTRFIIHHTAIYVAVAALIFVAASMSGWKLYQMQIDARHRGSAQIFYKMSYFKENINNFDAVFLGDSKAFSAMHPDRIDPIWKLQSFNLAHWSNWMPTQYAEVSDLIESLPPGFVVVWSVGHINFDKTPLRDVYPPGYARMPELMGLGYGFFDLLNAQMAYENWAIMWSRRNLIYDKTQAILQRPILRFEGLATAKASQKNADEELLSRFKTEPGVGYTDLWYDEKQQLASIGQYKINGSYVRTEIRPEYYRRMQLDVRENIIQQRQASKAKTTSSENYVADEASWKLFIKILDLFEQHNIKLIVNVLEEAPFTYLTAERRDNYRAFMNGAVRNEVERRGGAFTYVDFNQFDDTHYFDYNHLNSKGVAKFTEIIGPKLKAIVDSYQSPRELH